MTTRHRQRWIVVAFVILLIIVSWVVVAIVDGVTHDQPLRLTPAPTIERTRTP